MKVGVNLINFGPGVTPGSLKSWAQLSESLGYHLLMTSDHIAITPDVQSRYPAPFFEPVSLLGWLAGVTDTMEIGTTVLIVPYRNPLEIARVFANVDQLSGGRFILGVGIGWAQEEFQGLRVPFRSRGAITNEYLEAIKLLWTQDVASYEGKFASFKNVHTAPRPVQTPHPPIWVGGPSEAALRRTVCYGDAWHRADVYVKYGDVWTLVHAAATADLVGGSVSHTAISPQTASAGYKITSTGSEQTDRGGTLLTRNQKVVDPASELSNYEARLTVNSSVSPGASSSASGPFRITIGFVLPPPINFAVSVPLF